MNQQVTINDVRPHIVNLPDRPPVMLAADLATFYEVETKRLSEAVRRNPDRFPPDFAFHLTREEAAHLKTQNAVSKDYNHLPLVFTRSGAFALSGVLKSRVAAAMSVMIHRAFAITEELAAAPRQPEPETIPVSKDRYIELLEAENSLLKRGVRKQKKRRVVRPLTPVEAAEILRLHGLGWSLSKIAKHLDRNNSIIWAIVRANGGPNG